MRLERYVAKNAGLRDLLQSETTRAMLHAKAEKVAAAARARGQIMSSPRESAGESHPIPLPIEVDSQAGAPRARAAVIANHPGALAAEKKHRILGNALRAAK